MDEELTPVAPAMSQDEHDAWQGRINAAAGPYVGGGTPIAVAEGPSPAPGDLSQQGPTPLTPEPALPPVAPIVPPAPVPPPPPTRFPATTQGAERAAYDALIKGNQAADARAAVAPELALQREAKAEGALDESIEAKAQAAELDEMAKIQKEGLDAAHAKTEEAQKAFKDFKFQDYWSQRSTGDKVLAGIFSGLARMSVGPEGTNFVTEKINRAIENDFRQQSANLKQKEKFAEWAKQGETDLLGRYNQEKGLLMIKQAKATDAAALEAKAQILRNGGTPEEAETNALAAGLRAKAASDYEKALAALAGQEVMKRLAVARLGVAQAPMTPADAKLAEMARDPNVPAEKLREFAVKNGMPRESAEKIIGAVKTQEKSTESQQKSAANYKTGTTAIDLIEKSKYKPAPEDIQTWLNNQRLVYGSEGQGAKGALLTIGQNIKNPFSKKPLVPQSEFEGLSPEAADYFGNVRRYMESIARDKSGAAISAGEWTNFYNQYGPNSPGGLTAARTDLRARFATSGVAGAQVEREFAKDKPSGEKPASPEDVNSEAPLPEDPAADEAEPVTKGGKSVSTKAPKWDKPKMSVSQYLQNIGKSDATDAEKAKFVQRGRALGIL